MLAIELRHLRYFLAVAEELNFSRAAERLFIAQPPLSAAIRQLEQEIGTELLGRTTRAVTLTDAGTVFAASSRRTLAALQRSVEDARRAASGELERLRIGFGCFTRFETMPAICRSFAAAHPHVAMSVEEIWNAKMAGALERGEIDVAISFCPERNDELCSATVRREEIVVLLAERHPLACDPSRPLLDFAGQEWVGVAHDRAPRFNEVLAAICRAAGFEPSMSRHALQTVWDVRLLAELHAVSLAPESAVPSLPPGVAAVALRDEVSRFESAVLWPPGERSAAASAFCELASSAFAGDDPAWPERLPRPPPRALSTAHGDPRGMPALS